MNIHKLARLTPFGREAVVQRVRAGVPVAVVAREGLQERGAHGSLRCRGGGAMVIPDS